MVMAAHTGARPCRSGRRFHGRRRVGGAGRRGGGREQDPRECHPRRPTGVGEKPRLSDPDEAARQDVLDEATQKLHPGEGHGAPSVVVGVILPVKRDALPIEGEQPVIADCHPMGIAPEIAQDGGRPAEGRLGVDDPIDGEQGVDEGMPLGGVAKVLGGTGEIELAPGVGVAKLLDQWARLDCTMAAFYSPIVAQERRLENPVRHIPRCPLAMPSLTSASFAIQSDMTLCRKVISHECHVRESEQTR